MRIHRLFWDLGKIVLCLGLAGCSSWQVQAVSPGQLFQSRPPGRVRVTRSDSTQLVIDQPRLGADGLAGVSKGVPVSVPLTQVRALAVRRGDPAKTVGLVVGLSTAGLIVGAVTMQDCCAPSSFSWGGD